MLNGSSLSKLTCGHACLLAGKGAYPNYVMDGVIDGFSEMNPKIGVASIRNASQIKGLWTWSRGASAACADWSCYVCKHVHFARVDALRGHLICL